jgi:hypothetical protein
VEVEVGEMSVMTDVEGRFAAAGLPTGEAVRIVPLVAGVGDFGPTATVGEPEVIIRLPARGKLRMDLHGAAEGPPEIVVFRGPWWDETEELLDYPGYGSEAFVRIEPNRLELDLPVGPASLRLRVPPGVRRLYPDLEICAGETTTLAYDFPRHGRITGLVLDPEGEPVEDAWIYLAPSSEGLLGRSGRNGRFQLEWNRRISGPPDVGPFRLEIWKEGLAPLDTAPLDLAVDQELTLRLKRPGTVRIRLVGPDGEPADGEVWRELGAYPWDCPGSVTLDALPIGRVRLGARREDGEAVTTEVEVIEGGETSVTIHVP